MHIIEVLENEIVSLQKELQSKNVKFLVLSACASSNPPDLLYKMLILDDKNTSDEIKE